MQILTTTVSRILYAVPFGIFGLFHFMNTQFFAENVVPKWLPASEVFVYITGLGLILACVSMLIQKKARLACLLLAAMLIIFVLLVHLPGVMAGNQMSMPSLLKDTALAGAALAYAGLAKD